MSVRFLSGCGNLDQRRYYGGWLAPNIYFLGCAGSVLVNGMRITGSSGIFNSRHFSLGEPFYFSSHDNITALIGHYERVPYDSDAMRSIYHIREYNVRRLSLVRSLQLLSFVVSSCDSFLRLRYFFLMTGLNLSNGMGIWMTYYDEKPFSDTTLRKVHLDRLR